MNNDNFRLAARCRRTIIPQSPETGQMKWLNGSRDKMFEWVNFRCCTRNQQENVNDHGRRLTVYVCSSDVAQFQPTTDFICKKKSINSTSAMTQMGHGFNLYVGKLVSSVIVCCNPGLTLSLSLWSVRVSVENRLTFSLDFVEHTRAHLPLGVCESAMEVCHDLFWISVIKRTYRIEDIVQSIA